MAPLSFDEVIMEECRGRASRGSRYVAVSVVARLVRSCLLLGMVAAHRRQGTPDKPAAAPQRPAEADTPTQPQPQPTRSQLA